MDTFFFLGANSRRGFFSLYDELIDPRVGETLYILKGGPGCGKSSFMRRIKNKLCEAGFDTEQILCSGDPGSLDAVVFPALGLALVDGTAPHVIEPRYPAVTERYLNLGEFYDFSALKKHKAEVIRYFDEYKPLYNEAYRYIAAAAGLTDGLSSELLSSRVSETVARRTRGIAAREFGHATGTGRVTKRFIDAFTCEGPVRRYDSALSLCPKVFLLDNELDFAPLMLRQVQSVATAAGHDIILCPDPISPEKPAHLLIPELGICFLSSSSLHPYSGEIYRHVRLDALADENMLRAARPEMRIMKKAAAALFDRAQKKLEEAKLLHDELERVYNPYVDFTSLYSLADSMAEDILTKVK